MTRPTLESLRIEDHVLRETFGLNFPLTRDMRVRLGKAVLIIAAGDNSLSEREMAQFLGMARAMGADGSMLEELVKFDPVGQRVESYLDPTMQPLARIVLHDAIRVARVDGFHTRERVVALRAAERLGIPAGIVTSIESLIDVEDALRVSRAALVNGRDLVPFAVVPTGRAALEDPIGIYRREQYGDAPAPSPALANRIGYAILSVAAADRELSPREWAWFLGQGRALGAPREVLEDWLRYDARMGGRIEDFLDESTRPHARRILFDALRVARADGIAEPERDMAQRAATQLGLDPSIVPAMEAQLILEAGLRHARTRVLSEP